LPEAGATFARHIKREFTELTHQVLFEQAEAPQPIMGWMRSLTMGGNLAPPRIPIEAVGIPEAQMELSEGLSAPVQPRL
jgi:hypothetical protein